MAPPAVCSLFVAACRACAALCCSPGGVAAPCLPDVLACLAFGGWEGGQRCCLFVC